MFDNASQNNFGGESDEIHSFSGVEAMYNHGNQPSLHNAWLFNYSGQPWLTQKWTRAICDNFYGTGPLHGYGVGQDEDQGQLGAWFVMAALGLFDVQGHAAENPSFQFGSPLFKKVTIQLDSNYYQGKELVIETANNQTTMFMCSRFHLKDAPVENCWMERKQLMKGGKLVFEMGSQPDREWGIQASPPSMTNLNNK
jgi:putative alpha-1,2-mannosidase